MTDVPLILVVDDDRLIRMVVNRTLTGAGYSVIEAENGIEAIDAFRNTSPDLILMDVLMPQVDGFQACEEIRRTSEFVTTPILMLTSLDDDESIAKAFDAGASDFITKPIHPKLLEHRVRYSLRARSVAKRLGKSEARLNEVQRIARVAYWEYDIGLNQMIVSEDAHPVFRSLARSPASSWDDFLSLLHAEDREIARDNMRAVYLDGQALSIEFRVDSAGNGQRRFYMRGEFNDASDSGSGVILGSLQDVSEMRKLEEQLEFLANNDSLTGLPNRAACQNKLAQVMMDADRQGHRIAVLLLDLDNFKTFNDTLGPEQGDCLLQAVAKRLGVVVDEENTLARLGGDEFAIVLRRIGQAEDAARVSTQVLGLFAEPFLVADQELFLTTSIGVAIYPDDATNADVLLKNADIALHRAKALGKNSYRYFTADMNAKAVERLSLETALRRALDRDEFSLVYQPQVETSSGRAVGVEALLRWKNAEFGQVSPVVFIPILEEIGLINTVGGWALRKACMQCRQWVENGFGKLRISINLSGHQFEVPGLLDFLGLALVETGLDPGSLELEITENVVMHDTESTLKTFQALCAAGIRIAVDDFGTGYSSLAYLRKLPVNVLKIDKSFVINMDKQIDDTLIVRSTIDLAHNLGLEVVAEGVENEESLELLNNMGCDMVQGYHLAKPMVAEKCHDWLCSK